MPNLWHCCHVDEVSTQGTEHVTLSLGREPGTFDGYHGSRRVILVFQLLKHFCNNLNINYIVLPTYNVYTLIQLTIYKYRTHGLNNVFYSTLTEQIKTNIHLSDPLQYII